MKILQSLKKFFTPKTVNIVRKYAAAKNSPTMNIPSQGSGTVNDEIGDSWQEVSERTLGLVRDFPLFAGAVANSEAFVVGEGIKPQLIPPPNASDIEKARFDDIESRFMSWANNKNKCDFEGRMNFFEMQALTERMEGEFGEFLAIDQFDRKEGYRLQMIEPLRLQDLGFHTRDTGARGGNTIWRGIEYKNSNRKIVAYHFTDPNDAHLFTRVESVRIPAERVHHGFKMQRAGQMRGITPFTSSILLAYQLRDYLGSEVTAQNLSSRWMAFVTAPSSGFHTDWSNEDNIDYDSTYEKYTKSLDYATIEYLKNGEQVVMNTQTRNANGFKNFNEIITRMIASSYQMPYELISQDYSGLNYTTLRAVRNDYTKQLKPKWQRKVSQFCQPVFEKWLRFEVLNGRLNLPGYFANPTKYTNVKWITPTMEQIDPLKEFQADLLKMRSGVKSPQEVIKTSGGDPQKVLMEYEQWQEQCEQKELSFPELANQTPIINNFEYIEPEEPEVKEEEDPQLGVSDDGRVFKKGPDGWESLR